MIPTMISIVKQAINNNETRNQLLIRPHPQSHTLAPINNNKKLNAVLIGLLTITSVNCHINTFTDSLERKNKKNLWYLWDKLPDTELLERRSKFYKLVAYDKLKLMNFVARERLFNFTRFVGVLMMEQMSSSQLKNELNSYFWWQLWVRCSRKYPVYVVLNMFETYTYTFHTFLIKYFIKCGNFTTPKSRKITAV